MVLPPKESIELKHKELSQFVLACIKSDYPCAAIIGPPGCGKSTLIHDLLGEHKVEYVSLALHNSPLALFRSICENPSAVILADDDASSKHPVINAIFKAATGLSINGVRKISINISAAEMKKIKAKTDSCDFTGKIIFVANPEDITKGRFSGALNSRMLTYKYDLTFQEKKYLIRKFSENPEKYGLSENTMTELMDFLEKFLTPACTDFDLRIFEKAIAIVKTSPTQWKTGVGRLLDVDPMYTKLTNIISICDDLEQPKSKRPELFAKVTGLSRSTYYDLCRKFGINKSNDKFTIDQDDYYKSALVDLVCQIPTKTKDSKKVQNSSQIQEHTDKEVDMMSNGVQ